VWDSAFSIMTDSVLNGWDLFPFRGKGSFYVPLHPHQLWGTTSHLSLSTVSSFPCSKVARDKIIVLYYFLKVVILDFYFVERTIHLHLMWRLKMFGVISSQLRPFLNNGPHINMETTLCLYLAHWWLLF
jgi:hypothetical protein